MTQTSWVFQRCNSRRVISNKKDHKSIVAGSDETPICSKQEAIAKYRRAADRPVSRHSATSYSFSEALSKVFHLASIHYGGFMKSIITESLWGSYYPKATRNLRFFIPVVLLVEVLNTQWVIFAVKALPVN